MNSGQCFPFCFYKAQFNRLFLAIQLLIMPMTSFIVGGAWTHWTVQQKGQSVVFNIMPLPRWQLWSVACVEGCPSVCPFLMNTISQELFREISSNSTETSNWSQKQTKCWQKLITTTKTITTSTANKSWSLWPHKFILKNWWVNYDKLSLRCLWGDGEVMKWCRFKSTWLQVNFSVTS